MTTETLNNLLLPLQWHVTTNCSNRCKHCYMYDDKTYLEERKKTSWFYLMAHSFMYGGVIYYISGCDLASGILAFGTHWFIDKMKTVGFINLLFDQIYHFGIILLIWRFLC